MSMTPATPATPEMYASSCVYGDVAIDQGVAIAAGVILIADPGSRLVIARGSCLGAGTVIHARQGMLVIEPETSLGSNVLVVGAGRLGAQACVGAGSTLINPQLAPRAVVPARSLLGDRSSAAAEPAAETSPELAAEPAKGGQPPVPVQNGHQNGHQNGQNGQNSQNGQAPSGGPVYTQVYGREQVQLLLATLFPARQPLGASPPPRSE
jgi:carbon dioxide concentrating mechanism protein CcmN